MGLFSFLTGSKERADVRKASKLAEERLAAGKEEAKGYLTGSTATGINTLNTGRDDALAALRAGSGNALVDLIAGYDAAGNQITAGETTARGDINAGYDQSRADLNTNYALAEDAINTGMAAGRGIAEPFLESGRRANALYQTALGLDGQDAAEQFYETYAASDPYREFNAEQANKAILQAQNARGASNSGRTQLALSRANLERGSQDLDKYLSRLSGSADRGANIATNLAAAERGAGDRIASIRTGLGDNLASGAINRGTSLASTSTAAANNLAELAVNKGTATARVKDNLGRGEADLYRGTATEVANLQTGQGNALADLASGYATQTAANAINRGNAMAATRGRLVENVTGLIGAAAGAYKAATMPAAR